MEINLSLSAVLDDCNVRVSVCVPAVHMGQKKSVRQSDLKVGLRLLAGAKLQGYREKRGVLPFTREKGILEREELYKYEVKGHNAQKSN